MVNRLGFAAAFIIQILAIIAILIGIFAILFPIVIEKASERFVLAVVVICFSAFVVKVSRARIPIRDVREYSEYADIIRFGENTYFYHDNAMLGPYNSIEWFISDSAKIDVKKQVSHNGDTLNKYEYYPVFDSTKLYIKQ